MKSQCSRNPAFARITRHCTQHCANLLATTIVYHRANHNRFSRSKTHQNMNKCRIAISTAPHIHSFSGRIKKNAENGHYDHGWCNPNYCPHKICLIYGFCIVLCAFGTLLVGPYTKSLHRLFPRSKNEFMTVFSGRRVWQIMVRGYERIVTLA